MFFLFICFSMKKSNCRKVIRSFYRFFSPYSDFYIPTRPYTLLFLFFQPVIYQENRSNDNDLAVKLIFISYDADWVFVVRNFFVEVYWN